MTESLIQNLPQEFDAKAFLKTLSSAPGVYQMFDANGEILYVGKAKHLKKRVASYFQRQTSNSKTAALVKQIRQIEIIVTRSESEALLLENNLIKKLRPRYNILFRDDKSYPYLFLSADKDYPRLDFHRGTKTGIGQYFGPYPNSIAVRESLNLLQKVFKLRQCEDTFFRHRDRPCLQYHIKRCSAPCVGLISPAQYQQDVQHTRLFLEGKNQQVLQALIDRMEAAAQQLDFEQAAAYRDQIVQLRRIQEQQYVISNGAGNVDIIAIATLLGMTVVQLLFIRNGRMLGNKVFFPKVPTDSQEAEILASFLAQYYLNSELSKQLPDEILVNMMPKDSDWLMVALQQQHNTTIKISQPTRGERLRWVQMASHNANQALVRQLANKANMTQRFEALQAALGLASLPLRLECFDISHTQGEATVGSCVVFDSNGPVKTDYRHYNIKNITQGDDYAAMKQVLLRRYARLKATEAKLPDIIFIDGGKGQLAQAMAIMQELQLPDIILIGVAKGSDRKAGLETLFKADAAQPINLRPDSLALHLVQQIRDEAHRFAITGHRQRRDKRRKTSSLEDIPGIGPKRRRDLLRYFGGLQELKRVSLEELTKTPGISRSLAERLYAALHTV